MEIDFYIDSARFLSGQRHCIESGAFRGGLELGP